MLHGSIRLGALVVLAAATAGCGAWGPPSDDIYSDEDASLGGDGGAPSSDGALPTTEFDAIAVPTDDGHVPDAHGGLDAGQTGPHPPWTDSNLPPPNWRPLSYVGKNAPDAYHIHWPDLCAQGIIHCQNGDPLYDNGSTAKVGSIMMGNSLATSRVCNSIGMSLAPSDPRGKASPCEATGDYGGGPYFARATDPSYSIHCNANCGSGVAADGSDSLEGESIHIPDGAIPFINGDKHLFILDEDLGIECDLWVAELWNQAGSVYFLSGGGTLNIGSGSCGPLMTNVEGQQVFDALGSDVEGVSTLVRPEEIVGPKGDGNGYIGHALYLSVSYNGSTSAYPAGKTDGTCPDGPNVEGEVIYLDTPGYAALMSSMAAPWKKTWLAAAHNFGFYDLDSSNQAPAQNKPCVGGNWTNFIEWGSGVYRAGNVTNPWETLAGLAASDTDPNDFSANGDTYAFSLDLSDTGLTPSNFHVLDLRYPQCVMQGTNCPVATNLPGLSGSSRQWLRAMELGSAAPTDLDTLVALGCRCYAEHFHSLWTSHGLDASLASQYERASVARDLVGESTAHELAGSGRRGHRPRQDDPRSPVPTEAAYGARTLQQRFSKLATVFVFVGDYAGDKGVLHQRWSALDRGRWLRVVAARSPSIR